MHALGSNELTLVGKDATQFELEAGVLYLRAGVPLDYETNANLAVEIFAYDPSVIGGSPVSATLGIGVTDINEAPTAATLTNVESFVFEGTVLSRLKVADIEISDDAFGANTISLSGEDAALFEADSTGLFIRAGVELDFETKATISITVNVADTSVVGSLPLTTAYTLNVMDSNDAPTAIAVTNATTRLADTTATGSRLKLADIVISDDAIGENLITLGGADAAVFETENNSLYLKAGVSLNAFTQDAYSVTLTASDASVDGPASPVEGSFTLSVYRPIESRGSVSLTAGVDGVLSADAVPVTYDGIPVTGQSRFWQIVEAEQIGDENTLYGRHTSGHLHRLPADESWALYGMDRIGNANSILLPSRPTPVQSPSPQRVPLELSGSVGLFQPST